MPPSAPDVDGVINLLKPVGITSAKALYRVRSITGIRKSGHAGTLDPAAEGVLVVCQGRATKLVEKIMDLPKVYRATARLDVTSVSFDSDRTLLDVPVTDPPDVQRVREALASFQGRIKQTPPRVSAVKLGGVPAYKTVGVEDAPPLRSRDALIYWAHLHAFDWPTLDFEIACGRGTYVRALIRDIGLRLRTGGCLTSLVRTAVGPFTLGNGWTFDALQSSRSGTPYLIPLDEARKCVETRPVTVPSAPRP
ncbi:MAG: tRNA pseudouridine(55) synthase TruB [Phycisphaerae bacterium]